MKRVFWVLSLLLLISNVPAIGQTVSTDNLTAKVPFDFILNQQTYPAGDYTIRMDTFENRIQLGNRDKWITVNPTWNIGRTNVGGNTRLVFAEVNGTHYLHQVWIAGQDHGHNLLHDAMENDIP